MMTNLLRRGEELARTGEQRTIERVAAQLRAMFGNRAVETADGQVAVTGKALLRRWLIDPALRFLPGELK